MSQKSSYRVIHEFIGRLKSIQQQQQKISTTRLPARGKNTYQIKQQSRQNSEKPTLEVIEQQDSVYSHAKQPQKQQKLVKQFIERQQIFARNKQQSIRLKKQTKQKEQAQFKDYTPKKNKTFRNLNVQPIQQRYQKVLKKRKQWLQRERIKKVQIEKSKEEVKQEIRKVKIQTKNINLQQQYQSSCRWIKKRQQALKAKAQEKKERELSQCTFTPRVKAKKKVKTRLPTQHCQQMTTSTQLSQILNDLIT